MYNRNIRGTATYLVWLIDYIHFYDLGHQVPQHLDPLTRKRGKQGLVEDGPVTHTIIPGDPRSVSISGTIVASSDTPTPKIVSIKKNGKQAGSLQFITSNSGITSHTNVLEGQTVQVHYYLGNIER